MNCVILGPTDINKIKKFGQINDVQKFIGETADFLAKHFDEVDIIPDFGLPFLIAKEFKKRNKNGNVIGFIPGRTKGGKDLSSYYKFCDEIKDIGGGWFNLNTELTRQSNIVLCFGLSAGVMIEISSIKYSQAYMGLSTKLFICENCISSKLQPEIENDIKNIFYFKKFAQLEKLLNKTRHK